MLATLKENYQFFFVFKTSTCQVKLCLFMIVCHIAMAISRGHSFMEFSSIFFLWYNLSI